jgi:5-methylcytosine-specific restriction endonuclease McrBC GTP-binding regulatory subunit McrB
MNDNTKEHIKYIFNTELDQLDKTKLAQNKGLSALCLLFKTNITQGKLVEKFGDSVQFNNINTASVPEFIWEISKYIDIKVSSDKTNQINATDIQPLNFSVYEFTNACDISGLQYSKQLITRFISSLITKPFVILTGLSGSGKTKLAQAFVQWICQDESQYRIIPVGADWTNREPLLGYPNALNQDEYIKPDNGALDLIIQANKHSELPYFLILDEMNLSHVERYFADFLSVMESKGEISLFAEGTVNNGVPAKLVLPSNLFIIGTVNIDETTYMFSPKVLDRANTIEFRVTKNEIETFFANRKEVNMDKLKTRGASTAQSFMKMAERREFGEQDLTETHKTLVSFFEQLKKTGAEFGYRSASEIIRLINQLTVIDAGLKLDEKLDIAIMQKLLPKLHGSRRKLCPVLITLGGFCVDKEKIENIEKGVFSAEDFDFKSDGVIFPISLEKITRMYKGAIENGFASYAEA